MLQQDPLQNILTEQTNSQNPNEQPRINWRKILIATAIVIFVTATGFALFRYGTQLNTPRLKARGCLTG